MTQPQAAGAVAVMGIILFLPLLLIGKIDEGSFIALMLLVAIVSVTVLLSDRLKEVDLKNAKLVLNEVKEVEARIEKVKAELAAMYGSTDEIPCSTFNLDNAKAAELGNKGGVMLATGVMRYVTGCITRERERLAQIVIVSKEPKELAAALVDGTKNDKVFRWAGPNVSLDANLKTDETNEPAGETP